LIDDGIMNLIHVESENSLVSADDYVLITSIGIYPRSGRVDMEWTAIENFRKAGAHQNLQRSRKYVSIKNAN
jgi:hypothetical protein